MDVNERESSLLQTSRFCEKTAVHLRNRLPVHVEHVPHQTILCREPDVDLTMINVYLLREGRVANVATGRTCLRHYH